MTRMVRKQVYIDAAQDTLLQLEAKRRGVTQARLIREAIDALFARPQVDIIDIRSLRGSLPGIDTTVPRDDEDRV